MKKWLVKTGKGLGLFTITTLAAPSIAYTLVRHVFLFLHRDLGDRRLWIFGLFFLVGIPAGIRELYLCLCTSRRDRLSDFHRAFIFGFTYTLARTGFPLGSVPGAAGAIISGLFGFPFNSYLGLYPDSRLWPEIAMDIHIVFWILASYVVIVCVDLFRRTDHVSSASLIQDCVTSEAQPHT